MKMSRKELMRMLSVEIVASLDAVVKKNHPETYREKVELSEMQKVADTIVDAFLHDVEGLERKGGVDGTDNEDQVAR